MLTLTLKLPEGDRVIHVNTPASTPGEMTPADGENVRAAIAKALQERNN